MFNFLLLEPDSIVEKQGWEIHWAKPIEASKVLERERYIRETVANSKHGKKRSIKALAKTYMYEDDSVYLTQMKVLQGFVKERFDATFIFDCIQIVDPPGYVGRVNVL